MKEIKLNNSKKVILVDDEDYPVLVRLNWRLDIGGYAKHTKFHLHSLIMNFPSHPRMVDHIDGNPLNNQKSNLRICTVQQNNFNMSKSFKKTTTSIYKGVSLEKRKLKKPWVAMITKARKSYNLGHYATEMEAVLAYDKKAVELFGQYARPNFPTA